MEIITPRQPGNQIRHALFDFDGTISLIREGWQDIMLPMMFEKLRPIEQHLDDDALRHLIRDYVTRLTGKQTIYQMIELADQIRKRGGTPLDPLDYKYEYLDRLEQRIKSRITGLESGIIKPHELMVPGSAEFLVMLRQRGVVCYLASGTDKQFVEREASLLGVTELFDGGIFGAIDDYQNFSKKLVIERILREKNISGSELVGIGDGYVEIENTKQVGGTAIGLPTFESNPTVVDQWKRDRLLQAGADALAINLLPVKDLTRFMFE